jgi:epoxide hydrolase-like predicted phosphatase
VIKAVLFDLGGVLVELDAEGLFSRVFGHFPRNEIWSRWALSPSVHAHETGAMDANQFAEAFVLEHRLDMSPDAFLADFKSLLKQPFPEAHELLKLTSQHYTTAILSNISAAHWQVAETMQLHSHVDHVLKSHDLGVMKPGADFYLQSLARIGIAPHEAVFLDDTQKNVEGALAVGMQSFCVYGTKEAHDKLIELDLL